MTKYEKLTIALSLAAFALSVVNSARDILPPSDNIQYMKASPVDGVYPVDIGPVPIDIFTDAGEYLVITPVLWDVNLYNPNDRPVTISSIHLSYLGDNSGETQEFQFDDMIVEFRKISDPQLRSKSKSPFEKVNFQPITLSPRQPEVIRLGIRVPVRKLSTGFGDRSTKPCQSQRSLNKLQDCFRLRMSSDIFGNGLKKDIWTGEITLDWNKAKFPRFVVNIITADRSEFPIQLDFYQGKYK